jgi:hypothetical protein
MLSSSFLPTPVTDPSPAAAATVAAAQALTTKEVIARKKAAMCGEVAKALGRISSGLYIVAAAQDNAKRCVAMALGLLVVLRLLLLLPRSCGRTVARKLYAYLSSYCACAYVLRCFLSARAAAAVAW